MNRPEQRIQCALVDHLRWRAPRDVWFCHPANGGGRTAVEGAIFKAMGVRPGTPDILLVARGRLFAIELKSANGRLSPAQIQCHEDLRRAGAVVGVAAGIDAAIELLTEWEILPEGSS